MLRKHPNDFGTGAFKGVDCYLKSSSGTTTSTFQDAEYAVISSNHYFKLYGKGKIYSYSFF